MVALVVGLGRVVPAEALAIEGGVARAHARVTRVAPFVLFDSSSRLALLVDLRVEGEDLLARQQLALALRHVEALSELGRDVLGALALPARKDVEDLRLLGLEQAGDARNVRGAPAGDQLAELGLGLAEVDAKALELALAVALHLQREGL